MRLAVSIIGPALGLAGMGQAQSSPAQSDPPAGIVKVPGVTGAQPVGDLAQYFGFDSYPPEAVRQHQEGRVVAQLQIDAKGTAVACAITTSSGSTALDQRTCDLALGRMAFTPANDEQGHPIASTYRLPVRWVLPIGVSDVPGASGPRFMPIKSFVAIVEQVVDADGRRQSCTARIDGQPLSDPQACASAMGDVSAALRLLPSAMRGHALVVFSESRQEYAGRQMPPISDEVDRIYLGKTVTRFNIRAGGKATDCKITGSPRPDEALARSPCAMAMPFGILPGTDVMLPVSATWIESLSVRRL